jgi:PAS domain S-box-containing protein
MLLPSSHPFAADGADLKARIAELTARLEEAEDTLRAIRDGDVDAIVVGSDVYTLASADSASNRFRGAALAQMKDAVVATDNEGRVTYLNPAAERLYGRTASSMLGGLANSFEIASGNAGVRVETSLSELCDDSGAQVGTLAVIRDVTERERAEAALARRERELQTLADNTPDILTRFDRQLRHVFVNAAVERITGRAANEFIGKTNRELGMSVELCDMWDAAVVAVFDKGETVSREFSYETCKGLRHFSTALVPERAASGEVVHVLGVTHDRTVEKEAQDALRSADRRKDEFLATLAHELRNPLAPVRTGLQVLRLTKDEDLAHRTQLMMERQLGQMVRLIDDLLELSRISSGKIVLRQERIELQSAIHTAIDTVRPQMSAARQVLLLELPSKSIWLQADAARICQVVSNLLANAAKYSPDGNKIRLNAHRRGDEAVITVADDGEGIPRNMHAHVFEMFTQVDRTLDRAQGGLGIGLALVKRLVEMHGGTVALESAGLGAGSTFTVRLPALAEGEGADCNVAPLDEAVTETKLRVLVVDDNVDAAETLAQLLTIFGHESRVADSGASALAIAREFRPSVVLLDIGMPGMNGYETARRMRAEDPTGSVTLVALTGWGADSDRIKAKEAGFDHHFVKPVEAAEVISVLQGVAMRQAKWATA